MREQVRQAISPGELLCCSAPASLCSWKVGDDSLRALGRMTSLLSLNVLGCHRLSAGAKAEAAHLLDSAHAFS